jgi:hypothetical protein
MCHNDSGAPLHKKYTIFGEKCNSLKCTPPWNDCSKKVNGATTAEMCLVSGHFTKTVVL